MARTQQETQVWNLLWRSAPPEVVLTRVECRYPAGFPDVMWWTATGRPAFVELKDEEARVRPEQRIFLRKLVHTGQIAHVLLRRQGVLYLLDPACIPITCTLDTTAASLTRPADPQGASALWRWMLSATS